MQARAAKLLMTLIKKFLKGFHYAFNGILQTASSESNMWVHLFAALVVIGCGFYFKITPTEWCIVAICIGMVMGAELFNTAIEQLTDLAHPQQHPDAGKVKDAAAGAVLVIAIGAAVAGLVVFWKYFFPA